MKEKNENSAAFPGSGYGLTKKEYFAAFAMIGFIIKCSDNELSFDKKIEISKNAVNMADELLIQIEENKNKHP